jgi:uncharacterized membrane protein
MKKILALITLIVITRIYLTNSISYIFIIWNIFLALVPYFIIININDLQYIKDRILLTIFIIFYPNTPYLITDLIHLCNYNFYDSNILSFKFNSNAMIWLDFTLLALTSLLGIYLSLILMKAFKSLFNENIISIYILSLLSGIAIYIGRFFRFNSWDIFINPFKIIIDFFTSLNANNIILILLFSILNLSIYLTFESKKDTL